MADIALQVTFTVVGMYAVGIVSFILSWFRSMSLRLLTYVLSVMSFAGGVWMYAMLGFRNGFFIGLFPVVIAMVSIMNAIRRNRDAMPV